MERVRFGVIGVGAIALRSHIPALEAMDDAEVVALFNPSRPNAEKGAELCRSRPDIVDDYREILVRPDVDAVVVASPNYVHKEQTVAALVAGKHVLCEKPMATTEEDCLAVYEAARPARTLYQIGLEMRYSNFFQKMSEVVQAGQIGRPRMMFCKEFRWPLMPGAREWRYDAQRSGSTLLEMNSHHFDLLNWFACSPATRVMAMGGNDVNTDGQIDNAWVMVEYSNGARGCLGTCKFSPFGNDIIEFTVVGEKGKLESSAANQVICQWGVDKPDKTVYHVAMDPAYGDMEREPSIKERWVLWERSMVYRQHRSFIDCIKDGKKPLADADVALQSALVPLAALRSLETGETVRLVKGV